MHIKCINCLVLKIDIKNLKFDSNSGQWSYSLRNLKIKQRTNLFLRIFNNPMDIRDNTDW